MERRAGAQGPGKTSAHVGIGWSGNLKVARTFSACSMPVDPGLLTQSNVGYSQMLLSGQLPSYALLDAFSKTWPFEAVS